MTSGILVLTEEMEKLSSRILDELQNFLVSSSGNLRDIDNGTHIKIPTGVGYVSFYKSADVWRMSFWIVEVMSNKELSMK